MTQITVDEFQHNPLGFLAQVRIGETLVVTECGHAIAEIRPMLRDDAPRRPVGLCEGQFQVPDDFDEPLPEDVLRDFENS